MHTGKEENNFQILQAPFARQMHKAKVDQGSRCSPAAAPATTRLDENASMLQPVGAHSRERPRLF